MVKKYPDFERGESASITGRTHIPPRIFKQTIRLNKQREQLEKMFSEVAPFNAAKKLPEIKALMGKMIPAAEKLRTYMHRAGAARKELESQIAALKKEVDSSKSKCLGATGIGTAASEDDCSRTDCPGHAAHYGCHPA